MDKSKRNFLRKTAYRIHTILPIIAKKFAPLKEKIDSNFSVNTEHGDITFICCQPGRTSHGLDFKSSSDEFSLWLEVPGWALLEVKDKKVYSQRLLSEAPWNKQDEFKGDVEEFLRVVRIIEKLYGSQDSIILGDSRELIVIHQTETYFSNRLVAALSMKRAITILDDTNPRIFEELIDRLEFADEACIFVLPDTIWPHLLLRLSAPKYLRMFKSQHTHFIILIDSYDWPYYRYDRLFFRRYLKWNTPITFLKVRKPEETADQILLTIGSDQIGTGYKSYQGDSHLFANRLVQSELSYFQRTLEDSKEERTAFSVYYPAQCIKDKWATLLTYSHCGDLEVVRKVKEHAAGEIQDPRDSSFLERPIHIKTGSEIQVVPQFPGIRFNPIRSFYDWEETWHVARFRFRVEPKNDQIGIVAGVVAYYVGPVLVAEVPVSLRFLERSSNIETGQTMTVTAEPFAKVFVSYAHSDRTIVEALEQAYEVLGIKYLRDQKMIRSGENWMEKLNKLIDEAEVFQLCWSQAASKSEMVRKEFEHAWGRINNRPHIRPCRWENQIPEPWDELKNIHFAWLDLRLFQH